MTVHIARLVPKLHEKGISVQMYNLSSPEYSHPNVIKYSNKMVYWLIRLFFCRTEKIHYIFSVRPIIRFIAVIFGILRNKKIILRIGGASLNKSITQNGIFVKFISIFALQYADAVVGVNKDICEIAIKEGVNPKNVYCIPGFIPPMINDENIPGEVSQFLKNKSPKMLVTGILAPPDKADIYGIRDTIDMMLKLEKKYSSIGLIIYLQNDNKSHNNYFINFKREIIEKGLGKSVLVYISQSELWPVFNMVDLFIRPSYSDGDANSIREALYFGVPVVASDCVRRPNSVITFNTGDKKAFYNKIIYTLNNIDVIKSMIEKTPVEDNAQATVDLIKYLLSNNNQMDKN